MKMSNCEKLHMTNLNKDDSEVSRETRRATVVIPHITESKSSIKMRNKNRKIVESLSGNKKRMFTF